MASDEKGRSQMGSAAASLLLRGLRLGKKVAIAGAAIASAPAVIPPLVVGLALSFPFGVYFAGFACTDRVMRALLSSPIAIDDKEGEEEEKDNEMVICPPEINIQDIQMEEAGEKEKSSKKADDVSTMMPATIDNESGRLQVNLIMLLKFQGYMISAFYAIRSSQKPHQLFLYHLLFMR